MTPMRPVLVILIIALLGIYSCGDDPPTGGDGNGGGTIGGPFPCAVGMLWKYQVYDSLTQSTDTVWVSVTDSVLTRCGYIGYNWRTYWPTGDSVVDRYARVWIGGDTIDFISDTTCEPTMLERFAFPLELGAAWTGPLVHDTSQVTDTGSVSVPAGTFRNSAYVEQAWNLDFEGGGSWRQTWLAPDVGIVYRHVYRAYSDGQNYFVVENQIWELIDYDLSSFALDQFPNTVGTEWVYRLEAYTNLDTSLVDTVTVTIIDRISMSGWDSVTVWEYIGDEFADTMFVAVSGSRVNMTFDTLGVASVGWDYQFPLTVGRHWGIVYIVPAPTIDDKDTVTTPAGRFPTGFHYTMSGGAFNHRWFVDDWLVPGVGMAKRTFGEAILGPGITQEWTLLSYRIEN